MKSVYATILVPFLFLFGESWAAEKPFIDQEYKVIEEKISNETIDCSSKEKNPLKKIKCGQKIRRAYEEKGLLRGTNQYCEKRYGKMGFTELEQLLQKIDRQKNNARTSPPPGEKLPGEVVHGHFMVEEIWIKLRLGEMQKTQRAEQRLELFKEPK